MKVMNEFILRVINLFFLIVVIIFYFFCGLWDVIYGIFYSNEFFNNI